MKKYQSVVTLDPIDRKNKQRQGVIGRFMITRRLGGKGIKPLEPFSHIMFCGSQGSGKTTSMLFYLEYLTKRYSKRGYTINIYSNMGFGKPISKYTISPTIRSIVYDPEVITIICIDEIHTYFPKDTKDKTTLEEIDKLVSDFSQLRKRSIFVLSTSQIYGRVNKSLREQCMYMVACRKSKITNRLVNDFILGDDILCDELGRWSGVPQKILVHGLPKMEFDTHLLITS